MNEAYWLDMLDSTLDVHEWDDDVPVADELVGTSRLSDKELDKLLGDANLDMTRQEWLRELIKIHEIGCVEYVISTLFVLPFNAVTYDEILCALLRKKDRRPDFDPNATTAFWQDWWKNNHARQKYSTLLWREKSPRLRQAVYAFTLPSIPSDLTASVKSPDPVVRLAFARNIHIPSSAKAELARDQEVHIRLALAESHETTPELLDTLAQDPHSLVRRWVAANPNAHKRTLALLSGDRNPKVREFLKQNKKWSR